MPRDYGEMMADAAGDGFESPEQANSTRYRVRLDRDPDTYFPDLEEAGQENPTQVKSLEADNRI